MDKKIEEFNGKNLTIINYGADRESWDLYEYHVYDEDYLEDLQDELMEFEGLTNKVKSILKPQKSSKKFKNRVVYE